MLKIQPIKVYCLESSKMIISRNVQFHEYIFPCVESKDNTTNSGCHSDGIRDAIDRSTIITVNGTTKDENVTKKNTI